MPTQETLFDRDAVQPKGSPKTYRELADLARSLGMERLANYLEQSARIAERTQK